MNSKNITFKGGSSFLATSTPKLASVELCTCYVHMLCGSACVYVCLRVCVLANIFIYVIYIYIYVYISGNGADIYLLFLIIIIIIN